MKQVEYSRKVLRESFIIGCTSPSENRRDLLNLNFSDWLNVFDQPTLIEEVEKYKFVGLTLKNVSKIDPLISKVITEVLGPKLTELTFDNCSDLAWNKDIKKLLSESKGVQVLKLRKNKWLKDGIMEQLSIRFQASLVELEIEHSSNITNNGLFQIGRRCTELKVFRMICCNKITDAGLFELNKKIKLNSLHIHHSMQVTDNTIEALVSMAEKMTTMSFVNCPKLTDRSMAAFFEAKAAWGKRRNIDAQTITSLELRDNGNFTYETMNYLSTGLRDVAFLDFRDCSALNLVKGLNQINNLLCVTSLKLGPCKIDSAAFAECMLSFVGRLTVLHLNGMKGLIDEHLSNFLDEALDLEELYLEDISFGTLTCESIMSSIPNIARLTLIKSPIILDADLKAVITICLHIRELTVQRCPKISDGAFIRCVNLKYLEKVDIANCSGHCSGAIVKFLTVCPLVSLCIDGLKDCQPAQCFTSLNGSTYYSLRSISLRGCSGVLAEDVSLLLNRFVCCTSIDLTDTVGVTPQDLKTLKHTNPFLTFSVEKEFTGFQLLEPDRMAFVQYYAKLRQYRRHHGARCMQALRRKYLKRLLELKQVRRENWSAFKVQRVVKIQAQMRRFLVRRRFLPKLRGGRRIVWAARSFMVKFRYAKAHKAWKQYRRHLKIWLFKRFCLIRGISKAVLKTACEGVEVIHSRYLVVKTFRDMVQFKLDMVEKHFVDSALVVWEIAFLKSVLNRWKLVINETTRHRMKLLRIFLNIVDPKTLNSHRQKAKVQMADMFRKRRLVVPAWLCFAHDLLEIRRVASLEPMALEWFKKTFFNRVVGSVYYELQCHRNNRKFKRAAKIRGDRWYIYYKGLVGCRGLNNRMMYCIRERAQIELMKPQRFRYMVKLAYKQRFPVFTRHSIHFKLQRAMVDHYLTRRRYRVGYHDFFLGVVRIKKWRVMNKKAEVKRDRRYILRTYKAWCQYKLYKKDLGALYFKQYQMKQMRKVFKGLLLNLQMGKDYVAAMAAQAAAKAGSEKAFKKAVHHLRTFQAIVRGKLQRAKFKEERIQKLYAAQTIQNFVRVALARKQFNSKVKKKDLSEKVREDLELDAMREAEVETMFYNYQIKAVIKIQAAFRAWVGRGIAFQVAINYFRRWNIDFRVDNEHLKAQFEVFKRAALAREHQRAEAATMIQKHIRGIAARKIFKILKWKAKMAVSAVCVQREYRRRLAQLKLRRMKRDKLSDMRFRAARKQRGLLLRLFGLKDRTAQKAFKPFLDNLGLDPITFNYRVGELVNETISDFYNLVDIFDREKALVKEHGIKRNVRSIERRKIVAEQGWKMKIQDAVRIIEQGHKYEGYTGTIVRIDDSVLGIPLYEIKLDRFPLRQSFVRMTADPLLNYTEPQPLSKVRTVVSIPDLPHEYEIYGLNPEDPFYSQKNIDAAWKIQCFYRCHRSRMIVARKRYEFWMRCCATQWSLFNHMSETNTLSMQGYHVAQALKISSAKPVFFDEIRHFILPSRLVNAAKKSKEEAVINKEFEQKYRDRMTYLQKCAMISGKQFFAVGFERMTFGRKVSLFSSMAYGLLTKGRTRVKDVTGSKGVKFLSKQQSMVTGLDKYCFKQFQGSPHVRYYKTSLYQGEWSGVPLFTPLKPHGEGLVSFLDGWGFAREDKVLYLTIVRCQYLNPMDLTSSDPYCDISCNGFNLQTTVKWKNLNPEYHESFEIDVTNPNAMLVIVVKDKDFLGSDDFMGQVQVCMNEFIDGKEHQRKYNLKGEEYHVDEGGYDRGEIEFRCRWAQRVFEDDQIKNAEKRLKAIRIQSWARRIAALALLRKYRKEKQDFMVMVRNRAMKITSVCRMRLARKEFKKRFRFARAALKIQKRVRIWIAKKVFARKKLRARKATIIQARMRVVLAKNIVIRMKQQMAADLDAIVTKVQKNARRMIVLARCRKAKADRQALAALQRSKKGAENNDTDDDSVNQMQTQQSSADIRTERDYSWIKTYGRDPEYGLKRNRRITKRLFDKMLTMRFVRLQSSLGTVYMDSYPPKLTESEILSNIQGNIAESLTVRADFVGVYLPPFRTISFHRPAAIELCKKYEHIAVMHLESSIYLRKSVDYTVTIIQCAQRCRVARKARVKMLRVLKAIAVFQRIFRRRYEVLHKCSIVISSLFRLIGAKLRVRHRRKERRAAWIIEAGYRCYRARCAVFDRRCVTKLSVLRATPSVEFHGPEKCLEHRDDTFWLAESHEKAELRIEFGKIETLTEIWIMTSTYSTSAQNVLIEIVPAKSTNYVELLEQTYLPLLKERRWHKFKIPVTATKYFKFTFNDNYGDDKYIGVRQIRFVRSREKSVKIIKEPSHYVLDNGPMIGHTAEIILKVEADGWPMPTYQWYKKNKKIKGATTPELKLSLHCAAYGQRTYRCIRCKMISKEVPLNAFHIKCGNCAYLFNYKDVDEYDQVIHKLKDKEVGLHRDKNSLMLSKIQMEQFNNPNYKSLLHDVNEQLRIIEYQLQKLREERITLKDNLETVNRFSDEGIYTCHIQNLRGGSFKIKRQTVSAVVVVEHSKPYLVPVVPTYTPRPQTIRKKWNIYSSIMGTFKKDKVEGLVVIRYYDGSYYEGPYVQEDAVDNMGCVEPTMRAFNHFGVYKMADGRVFEGVNVDNHFDPHNLQSFYRLRMPDGELYEGNFCDEFYHGIGMYTYKDGSVYEGSWHRGTRFGHGHYRSSEGWAYEGFYDTNRRHREGIITWPDGSCYMGDWYYDKIQGKGIFVTALKDIYRGELVDGQFHGTGEMIYGDGSRYVGNFAMGLRQGRGIFSEKEGNEYYGHFVKDLYHGEVLVKLIIPIEEKGQDNFEIRIAVYDNGHFVKWKSKFSNPLATKQFIALFKDNRDMFDSVYSMILAKNLPALPDGIDAGDPQVKQIVFKIRNEAGMLVGQHALNQAQSQLDALLKPLKEKTDEVEQLKQDIENMSMKQLVLEKDAAQYNYKFTNIIVKYEKETQKIEQYWTDDPREVRGVFQLACEQLDTVSVEEFFAFRNHRVVPLYVKKIFDAISVLLKIPLDWKIQQFIIADSVANSRNGDEEAVRFDYKCKLYHLMKEYKVYDFVSVIDSEELAIILADCRFRSDSYYIESLGKPGPILVDWVKTNYAYVKAAMTQFKLLNTAEESKIEAFRYKAIFTKKSEEVQELIARLDEAKNKLKHLQIELEDLQHLVLKANDLLQFITGRTQVTNSGAKADYYKLLEQKMEANRDKFVIEVCLQSIMDGVVENMDKDKKAKIRECLALGVEYVEPDMRKVFIVDWMKTEILDQQDRILGLGKTLGYSFEPEATDVTKAYTEQIISLVIDITIAKMNDRYNDLADARQWVSMKGRTITSRFLYIQAWKIWEKEAIIKRDIHACKAWEDIFITPEQCAKMAIEARISTRMSKVAREQAKVWAKAHPDEIAAAEVVLSNQFQETYPEDTARAALGLQEDAAESISPADRALCMSWVRLHPTEMNVARDELTFYYSEEFAKQFPASTGETAFKILNGWGSAEEMLWIEYADHWKSWNLEKYNASSDMFMQDQAKDFVEAFPLNSIVEAARVLENSVLYQYVTDEETLAACTPDPKHILAANCWGLKNQGLLRKGRELLRTENMNNIGKQWNELLLNTENFQKGHIMLAVNKTLPNGDVVVEDRFVGYRARLMSKFAWMYAYFCKQREDLVKDIADHNMNDPIEKVFHNIRPSEREKVMQEMEDEFLNTRKRLEETLAHVIEKITSWNTYFGLQEMPSSAGGAI